MKVWVFSAIVGLIIGAFSAFSPGLLFIAFLALGTGFALYRFSHPPERRFLLLLFVVGFLLRAGVSLALDLGSWIVEGRRPIQYGEVHDWDLGIFERTREYVKMGDSDFHSQRGYSLAQYARGSREPGVLYRIQQYGWSGYAYVIGFFYYLFGFSPVAVKMINCLLGALLGPVIFSLARGIFHSGVARWASVGVAFYPSLILWSATNLKEASFLLLTAVLLLLVARIQRERWGKRLLLLYLGFLLALLLHATLRSVAISWVLAAGCGLSMGLLSLKRRTRWGVPILLLGVALLAIRWDGWGALLTPAFRYHLGFVGTLGISYQYLPAEFYEYGKSLEDLVARLDPLALASILLRAALHFLLQPLPSKMDNLGLLLLSPQMVVWYLVLPVALFGIVWSLARNLNRSLFLVLALTGVTLLLALSSGSVGTAFRMRDVVTPFFLIFASAGASVFLKGPKAFHEAH